MTRYGSRRTRDYHHRRGNKKSWEYYTKNQANSTFIAKSSVTNEISIATPNEDFANVGAIKNFVNFEDINTVVPETSNGISYGYKITFTNGAKLFLPLIVDENTMDISLSGYSIKLKVNENALPKIIR